MLRQGENFRLSCGEFKSEPHPLSIVAVKVIPVFLVLPNPGSFSLCDGLFPGEIGPRLLFRGPRDTSSHNETAFVPSGKAPPTNDVSVIKVNGRWNAGLCTDRIRRLVAIRERLRC